MKGLFDYFGYEIEHDLDNELSIKKNESEQILKIPKHIFNDFWQKWSQTDQNDPLSSGNSHLNGFGGANGMNKNSLAKSMKTANNDGNIIADSSKQKISLIWWI